MGRPFQKDDPQVWVRDNNIGQALRVLRSRVENSKIFQMLKEKQLNPKASDRRKAKRRRAFVRNLKKGIF
jgi:ribosomal protein S21